MKLTDFRNFELLNSLKERMGIPRYVVSTRTDGQFNLNFIDGGVSRSSLHRLMVCQNCLGHLGFNGFLQFWGKKKRIAAVQSFALEDFFAQYPRSLHVENPKYNSD